MKSTGTDADGCNRSQIYLKNHAFEFHQIFCTCYPWPWLGPPLTSCFHIIERIDPMSSIKDDAYVSSSSSGGGIGGEVCRPDAGLKYVPDLSWPTTSAMLPRLTFVMKAPSRPAGVILPPVTFRPTTTFTHVLVPLPRLDSSTSNKSSSPTTRSPENYSSVLCAMLAITSPFRLPDGGAVGWDDMTKRVPIWWSSVECLPTKTLRMVPKQTGFWIS